jgi:hypothetical protein
MFLTPSDFTGKYELSQGMYNTGPLLEYIEKYEKRYLLDLLGAELYKLLEADSLGPADPIEPRFLVIFNSLLYDYGVNVYESGGIKEMLKGFIYFEFLRDTISQATINGNVRPVGENSAENSTLYSTIWVRYNEGVKSYQAIQKYIFLNPENYDYTKFNGKFKQLNYWL